MLVIGTIVHVRYRVIMQDQSFSCMEISELEVLKGRGGHNVNDSDFLGLMGNQGIFIVTQPKSSHPSPNSVRFVLIGLQNRETRRYVIHCKLEMFV